MQEGLPSEEENKNCKRKQLTALAPEKQKESSGSKGSAKRSSNCEPKCNSIDPPPQEKEHRRGKRTKTKWKD